MSHIGPPDGKRAKSFSTKAAKITSPSFSIMAKMIVEKFRINILNIGHCDRTIIIDELVPLMMPYISEVFHIDRVGLAKNDRHVLQVIDDILKNIIENEERRLSRQNAQFLEMCIAHPAENDGLRTNSIARHQTNNDSAPNKRPITHSDANQRPRKAARVSNR